MDETLKLLYELAQDNNFHIGVLNDELGDLSVQYAAIKAQVDIIMWFIAINIITWVGAVVGLFIRKIFKNGK